MTLASAPIAQHQACLASTIQDDKLQVASKGRALRSASYDQLVNVSARYRETGPARSYFAIAKACNYVALKTGPRNLLNALVEHLNHSSNQDGAPAENRFVVFPSNGYLALALGKSERTIQRWAACLEDNGLLRRCYTAFNTRIGYDLAGFIAQVDDIISSFEAAIAAKRKARIDARQQELALGLPGEIPITFAHRGVASVDARARGVTDLSSRGDKSVTLNNETGTSFESTKSFAILDMVDTGSLLDASGMLFREDDRSGDRMAAAVLAVTRLMIGPSGRPSRPWRQATALLGEERAVVLWLCATLDPMRKGVPAQYFAWLVRALTSSASVPAVTAAIGRAVDAAKASSIQAAAIAKRAARKAAEIAERGPLKGHNESSAVHTTHDWDSRSEDGVAPPADTSKRQDLTRIDDRACQGSTGEDLINRVRAVIPANVARYHLEGACAEPTEHGFTLFLARPVSVHCINADYTSALDRLARHIAGPRGFAVIKLI